MEPVDRAENELLRGDLGLELPLVHLEEIEREGGSRIDNVDLVVLDEVFGRVLLHLLVDFMFPRRPDARVDIV